MSSRTDINAEVYQVATAHLALLNEYTWRSYRSEPTNEAKPGKGWIHETQYTFADGSIITLNAKFAGQIVFPAAPGFDCICFERPEIGDPATYDIAGHIQREPIIAWELGYNHGQSYVVAVTPSYADSYIWRRFFGAVAFPDGRIEWRSPYADDLRRIAGGDPKEVYTPTIVDSVEAWIALVRKVWAVKIEHEAKEEERRARANEPCEHCGRGHDLDDEIPF